MIGEAAIYGALKEKAARRRLLLIYLVLVFLLAWDPWNGWFIAFGGALHWASNRFQKIAGRDRDSVPLETRRKRA
jgi:hypothetical protein